MGVVDEVQMIEDQDRGGAWTRAILGESESTHTAQLLLLYCVGANIVCTHVST